MKITTSSQELSMSSVVDVGSNNNHIPPRSNITLSKEVGEDKNGVFLSWEDIWVKGGGKSGNKAILQGLTGYASPGQLLAIMGPSGCGKSTLLDSLAGRLSTNTRQTNGEILINGTNTTLAYGTSAYVTQDDALLTTLTVGEAVFYSAQLQLPSTMSISDKKQRAEMTIKDMGLQDSINTRIGGFGSKGISGGQKRRVSICIEILTHPKLLFLDEPTSGLDSAASYYVMSRIASLGRTDRIRRTVVTSIHQPSSDVFQLFDNLCLLSTGRTVYFGPASEACEFFASNGFPCPTLQNPSDHFLKTINKDFERDIEQGFVDVATADESINILVKAYKSSNDYQQLRSEVSEVSKQLRDCGKTVETKRNRASFVNQCYVLTKRSFVNMYRDLGYYWMRLLIYIGLGLGLGSSFYQLGIDHTSVKARESLIMFIATFLTFMSIGGFPSFVEDMKVFGRERLNGHYGVTAFVFGNTFSSIPFLLLNSIIPGVIVYYLTGLRDGYHHFLYFASVLFACMMLIESMMMIVSSIVPNFLMGIISGAGIQGLMMLGGGFFRLPNDLPKPFWRYPLYYIAFHRYAYQGLFKNEFIGAKLRYPGFKSGEHILRYELQVEMGYSKWVDLGVLLGMVVLYRAMFLLIVKICEKVKPFRSSCFSSVALKPASTSVVMEIPLATPLHGEESTLG